MERQGGQGAAALLGLAGFVLVAAVEHDGEVRQSVETPAVAQRCPAGGTRARSKGRRSARCETCRPAGDRTR